MSILTRPIEELLSYLLTRLHGGLLLQQLDYRNFQTNVAEGIYTLKDIQLNPLTINQSLTDSVLHLFSSSIAKITMQVPNILKFLDDPINLQVHHLVLDLCSASESGCKVIREEKQVVETEEDIQGITVLTKSVESFLSNINLQASMLKIRIRVKPTDSVFLQITIPKVTFEDCKNREKDCCQKKITIEGLRISMMCEDSELHDPHDFSHVLIMEKPIIAEVSVNRDLLFIESIIDKIIFLLSFEQMSALLHIFTNLKKSNFYDELKVSILMEAFQAFGEDIQGSFPKPLKIREKLIKFAVGNIHICTCLEEAGSFRKKWNYNDGIYPGVPTSHIVITACGLNFSFGGSLGIKIMKILAFHYNYLSNPALDCSDIYASAKQSFFNDFFRNKPDNAGFWESDPNNSHFCSGNILQFRRSHTEFTCIQPAFYRQLKQDFKAKIVDKHCTVKIAGVDIHTNTALLASLNRLITPSTDPPVRIVGDFKVSIPYIRVQYQENFDKCFCAGKEWMLMGELSWLNITNSIKLELSFTKFDLSLRYFISHENEMVSNIAQITSVQFIREIKEPIIDELLEERKEEKLATFYEPQQGTIYVKPGKHTEPFDMSSTPKRRKDSFMRSQLEEEMGFARALCVNKVVIDKIGVRIEPGTLKVLLKMIPTGKNVVDNNAVSLYVDVGSLSVELLDRENDKLVKPVGPSMFSYYSLDASISRNFNAANDTCIGLISFDATNIKVFSLSNCMKKSAKYTKIKVECFESYAKHQELVYSTYPNVIDIIIDKNDIEETQISIRNIVICLDVLINYLDFLGTFSIDVGKVQEKMERKHLTMTGILLDFYKGDKRIIANLESANAEITSIDSISLGLHATLSSLRLYSQSSIKHPHPIFSQQTDSAQYEPALLSVDCTLISTLDSLEFFITKISSTIEGKVLSEDIFPLPYLKCMLGSKKCSNVSGPVYIADEIRTSILQNKLLDVHINIGTIIVHLTTNIVEFLHEFIEIPKFPEEKDEFLRKDSDLSSDDSDTLSLHASGLVINPSNPNKIENINLQDYLNPERISKKKISNPLEEGKVPLTKLKTVHCHHFIPSLTRASLSEGTIHSLNPEHGLPLIRFSSSLSLFVLNIYSRQPDDNTFDIKRGNLSRVMIQTENMNLCFAKFPKRLHYSWRVTLTIEELKVLDYILMSRAKSIVKYDTKQKRKLNSNMVSVEVCGVWPRPSFMNETEMIVKVALLPLKVNIDQFFVEFCLGLANWKPEEQVLMHQTGNLPSADPPDNAESKQMYLQKLIIDTLSLNIDYIPHNFDGKHPGATLLNLFPIKDFHIVLPRVDIKGVKNLKIALGQAFHWWVEYIKDKEIYKLLSCIGPLYMIKSITGKIVDIVSVYFLFIINRLFSYPLYIEYLYFYKHLNILITHREYNI